MSMPEDRTADDRRYTVHFLVAKDGHEYSALCYEFTTGGCGPDGRSALEDAIIGTIQYLEYLIDEGREADAHRPASAELVAEFLDLPIADTITRSQFAEALEKVVIAPVVLARGLLVRYDLQQRNFSPTLTIPSAVEARHGLNSYPAELVLAGAQSERPTP